MLTPLHLACWYGQESVVKLLLGHGADVNALDKVSLKNTSYLTSAHDSMPREILTPMLLCGFMYQRVQSDTTVTVIYPEQRYIYEDSYRFHQNLELDIDLCQGLLIVP